MILKLLRNKPFSVIFRDSLKNFSSPFAYSGYVFEVEKFFPRSQKAWFQSGAEPLTKRYEPHSRRSIAGIET
jgi:hypothetical protein